MYLIKTNFQHSCHDFSKFIEQTQEKQQWRSAGWITEGFLPSDHSICLEWSIRVNADTVINHSGFISRRDSVMSWHLNMPFFRHEYQAPDYLASCLHFVREQLLSIQWQAGQHDACFLTNGHKSSSLLTCPGVSWQNHREIGFSRGRNGHILQACVG